MWKLDFFFFFCLSVYLTFFKLLLIDFGEVVEKYEFLYAVVRNKNLSLFEDLLRSIYKKFKCDIVWII